MSHKRDKQGKAEASLANKLATSIDGRRMWGLWMEWRREGFVRAAQQAGEMDWIGDACTIIGEYGRWEVGDARASHAASRESLPARQTARFSLPSLPSPLLSATQPRGTSWCARDSAAVAALSFLGQSFWGAHSAILDSTTIGCLCYTRAQE